MENSGDDSVSDKSHEAKGEQEDRARENRGEGLNLVGDGLLIIAGEVTQAGGEVAGAFADGKLIDYEVGEAAGFMQGEGKAFAFEHAIGGIMKGALQRGVREGALGHAQGFRSGDPILEEYG